MGQIFWVLDGELGVHGQGDICDVRFKAFKFEVEASCKTLSMLAMLLSCLISSNPNDQPTQFQMFPKEGLLHFSLLGVIDSLKLSHKWQG